MVTTNIVIYQDLNGRKMMSKVAEYYALQDELNGIEVEECFDDETLDEYFGCNLADVNVDEFIIKQG